MATNFKLAREIAMQHEEPMWLFVLDLISSQDETIQANGRRLMRALREGEGECYWTITNDPNGDLYRPEFLEFSLAVGDVGEW